MTRRGSCVKLNVDYTLARVPCGLCPLPLFLFLHLFLLVYSFFSVWPLRVSTSTTQSRGSPSFTRQTRRGGCFTQSVAIIEYLPARLSRSNDRASYSLGIAARVFARARRIRRYVPGKIPGATACCLPTDQVITCRLAGRDKNPPIAINHGELEKTARGNAHICASFPYLPLSFSLARARARTHVLLLAPAPRAPSVFCFSDSVVTGSAAGISTLSPLNAIPYDRDKTSESHLKLVMAVPRDYRTLRSETSAEVRNTIAFAKERERRRNLLYSIV